MTYATKQAVYKDISIEKKAPLNAFKMYINENPTLVAWHNGKIDDACKINGFHLHAITTCEKELWHSNAWRTLRAKLENHGIIVRTQRVRNLRAVLAHLHERPRIIMGCNNIYLAKYAKDGIDKIVSDMDDQFQSDEKLSPLAERELAEDFMADMLGWQARSPVSELDSDDETVRVEDIFFSDKPFVGFGSNKTVPSTSNFVNIISDKKETKLLPSTKTADKVGMIKNLCNKYKCHDQGQLLELMMENSIDDVKQWRVIRTAPSFNVIWTTAMEEFKSEAAVNQTSYLDTFIARVIGTEEQDFISQGATARLWIEWCKFQNLNVSEILYQIYLVLSKSLSKKNTFMLCGESDAGKTYWTQCLVLPDRSGQVITSADFMWQQCVDKELIVVQELTLAKYDQVESFKKVSEGLSTQVNVKNKPAVMLNRTPMLVTSNKKPWKFFNDEETPIKNRMFYQEVKKFDFRDPGSPNPVFFAKALKFIKDYVSDDACFPYANDTPEYECFVDTLQAYVIKQSKEKAMTGECLNGLFLSANVFDESRSELFCANKPRYVFVILGGNSINRTTTPQEIFEDFWMNCYSVG